MIRTITLCTALCLLLSPFAHAKPKAAAATSPCSFRHYPMAVGDVNEYRLTSNQLDAEKKLVSQTTYTYRESVVSIEGENLRTKSVTDENTAESNWICTSEGIMMKLDVPDTMKITMTGVAIPARMEVGAEWKNTFESSSESGKQTTVTTNRVTKMETVTVPAGSYKAYRVDSETESTTEGEAKTLSTGSQWFVPDVGLVKTTSTIPFEFETVRSVETSVELVKRTSGK